MWSADWQIWLSKVWVQAISCLHLVADLPVAPSGALSSLQIFVKPDPRRLSHGTRHRQASHYRICVLMTFGTMTPLSLRPTCPKWDEETQEVNHIWLGHQQPPSYQLLSVYLPHQGRPQGLQTRQTVSPTHKCLDVFKERSRTVPLTTGQILSIFTNYSSKSTQIGFGSFRKHLEHWTVTWVCLDLLPEHSV